MSGYAKGALRQRCISYATPDFKRAIDGILGGGTSFEEDGLKNLFFNLDCENTKKSVIIDAHYDRIGFVVTNILEGGFLRLEAVGSVDERTLLSQPLISLDGQLRGVFCALPPHLKSTGDKEAVSLSELALDVGLSLEEAKKRVKVGDLFCFDADGFSLNEHRFSSPGLDNSVGVCVLLGVLKELYKKPLKNTAVTFLLSNSEEVGLRGASAFSRSHYADEVIALDVSFANAPGVPSENAGNMAGGPMIGRGTVLSPRMTDLLEQVCKESSLTYQLEILGESTGTNADVLSLCSGGSDTALISVPIKNMHTQGEIVDIRDIENSISLILKYLYKGDAIC